MNLINNVLIVSCILLIYGCYSCPQIKEQFISNKFEYYMIIKENNLTSGELLVNKIQTDSLSHMQSNKPIFKMEWLDYNYFPDTIILVRYYNLLIAQNLNNYIIIDSTSVVNIDKGIIVIFIDDGVIINFKLRVPHRMCYRQIAIF